MLNGPHGCKVKKAFTFRPRSFPSADWRHLSQHDAPGVTSSCKWWMNVVESRCEGSLVCACERKKKKKVTPDNQLATSFVAFRCCIFQKKAENSWHKIKVSALLSSLGRELYCVHFVCLQYSCSHNERRHYTWNIYWPADCKSCISCRLSLRESCFSLQWMSVFFHWKF